MASHGVAWHRTASHLSHTRVRTFCWKAALPQRICLVRASSGRCTTLSTTLDRVSTHASLSESKCPAAIASSAARHALDHQGKRGVRRGDERGGEGGGEDGKGGDGRGRQGSGEMACVVLSRGNRAQVSRMYRPRATVGRDYG